MELLFFYLYLNNTKPVNENYNNVNSGSCGSCKVESFDNTPKKPLQHVQPTQIKQPTVRNVGKSAQPVTGHPNVAPVAPAVTTSQTFTVPAKPVQIAQPVAVSQQPTAESIAVPAQQPSTQPPSSPPPTAQPVNTCEQPTQQQTQPSSAPSAPPVKPLGKCRIICDDEQQIEKYTNTVQQTTQPPVKNTMRMTNPNMSSNYEGMYYDTWDQYDQNRYSQNSFDAGQINQEMIRAKNKEISATRNLLNTLETEAETTKGYTNAWQQGGSKGGYHYIPDKSRRIDGELEDELPYSDYNHLPVASGYSSHDYEYGYSFIPPEKWYPQPARPPICVTEKRCPVVPMYANGAPLDVKEFHYSRRITPPDMINTNVVNDKLNSGR
jgi:hypothetical protein